MRMIVNNSNGSAAHGVDTHAPRKPLLPPAHGGRPGVVAQQPAPKVSEADLNARIQDQRAARTLRRLHEALVEAEDVRAMNRVLSELVDEMEEDRKNEKQVQRVFTVVLLAVAAVAGYISGMLHAGLVS